MECLVQLLKSEDEAVKTLSASLVASLAHTRAGIPDGLIIAGMLAFHCVWGYTVAREQLDTHALFSKVI